MLRYSRKMLHILALAVQYGTEQDFDWENVDGLGEPGGFNEIKKL